MGHYRKESLTHDVNHCVLTIVDPKVSDILKTKWFPKPDQVSGWVLIGNNPIQIQSVKPIGHSPLHLTRSYHII